MSLFATYIALDWSGGNDSGATPKPDAIWACVHGAEPVYLRNRQVAEDWLAKTIEAAKKPVCLGVDIPFGYPKGFAKALTGQEAASAVWDWFEAHVEDAKETNNRFDLAGQINAKFSGVGPFWGNGLKRDIENLPRKGRDRTDPPFPERRVVETKATGSFTCWQLSGAGSVGSQVIMGLPVLNRLKKAHNGRAWPFEPLDGDLALVEIWPSLLSRDWPEDEIKDAAQVRGVAAALYRMDLDGTLPKALELGQGHGAEGWILGVGAEDALRGLPSPPRLSNDCFALPPGVEWTPVDEALHLLEAALEPVVSQETTNHMDAAGRVLASSLSAVRSNPPGANSAIDGYGFSHASLGEPPHVLPLSQGRAAAGAPFEGVLEEGHAVRVLTGALIPKGIDTVVLEEDCNVTDTHIAFNGKIKLGANTRRAGEDVEAGQELFRKGHRLSPQDCALMAALGIDEAQVFRKLRVGVLSTGDELSPPSPAQPPSKTYDANRPMLLQMAAGWGYTPVDLGHVRDDRDMLRTRLDQAAQECDVLLTSGGASAGDEDHVSALLRDHGNLTAWRIALKPGRPLALAVWDGMPVFGLPGNPVAAFVCTAIFARPAFSKLAGGDWLMPRGQMVPAAFSKRKKPGRREFLRARLGPDGVEVFKSEGSGRISGLSWADGLVELPDGEAEIEPGTPVRYISFAELGI